MNSFGMKDEIDSAYQMMCESTVKHNDLFESATPAIDSITKKYKLALPEVDLMQFIETDGDTYSNEEAMRIATQSMDILRKYKQELNDNGYNLSDENIDNAVSSLDYIATACGEAIEMNIEDSGELDHLTDDELEPEPEYDTRKEYEEDRY